MLEEIKKVFSREYQADVKFLEFKRSMREYVKLKNESESLDAKMERLSALGYASDCHIKVGEF